MVGMIFFFNFLVNRIQQMHNLTVVDLHEVDQFLMSDMGLKFCQ